MGGLGLSLLTSVIALVVNGRFYFGGLSRYGFPFLAFRLRRRSDRGRGAPREQKQGGPSARDFAAARLVRAVPDGRLLSLLTPGPSFQGENALPSCRCDSPARLRGQARQRGGARCSRVVAPAARTHPGRSIDAATFSVSARRSSVVVVSMLIGFPFGGMFPRYAGDLNLFAVLGRLITLLSLGARATLIFATQAVAARPVAPGPSGELVLGFLADSSVMHRPSGWCSRSRRDRRPSAAPGWDSRLKSSPGSSSAASAEERQVV